MTEIKTDIEIAREAKKKKPILELASNRLNLDQKNLCHLAMINLKFLLM